MENFIDRMIRAAKLDVSLYEEVEADKSALRQAMGVVVLASLAAGIGQIFRDGLSGVIFGTISALAGWYIWAYVTYFVGTRFFPEPQTEADHGQLLRTTGFSSTPGLLRIFGIIPVLGGLIVAISSIWMLVAMVIAVRQALDYSNTLRAVGVCIVGWIFYVIIFGFITFILPGI